MEKTLKWNYKPNSGQHHMKRNKTSKLNSKVYGFEFKKSMEKSRLKHKKQKKLQHNDERSTSENIEGRGYAHKKWQ